MAPIAQNYPFWGQKGSFWNKNPFFLNIFQIFWYHHDITPKRQPFCVGCIARRASGWVPGPIYGPKLALKYGFLCYTHITPLFWAQTDPTRWDHNIPISWGNSRYLWFSVRCLIGCLASSCMAPIAKYYGIVYHYISKRLAAGCCFERAPTNMVDFLDKQFKWIDCILVCSWLRRVGNASQGVSIYFMM